MSRGRIGRTLKLANANYNPVAARPDIVFFCAGEIES